ncbi:hypothetical protein FHR90_003273 [Endobacter medicaginis]|uniref:Uncharacterized protein n=1 Tax=Endobacter medicaginis TaxID=1181271 RepID=A0A839UYI6_9PROT|nr:hypothetical protein [Endobacter medicaginis]MBB3175418.1 hypothetical protein [Endobacter medicaginis]MCX5476877.1 hypothetical protein [Endobacter medicaginis]
MLDFENTGIALLSLIVSALSLRRTYTSERRLVREDLRVSTKIGDDRHSGVPMFLEVQIVNHGFPDTHIFEPDVTRGSTKTTPYPNLRTVPGLRFPLPIARSQAITLRYRLSELEEAKGPDRSSAIFSFWVKTTLGNEFRGSSDFLDFPVILREQE